MSEQTDDCKTYCTPFLYMFTLISAQKALDPPQHSTESCFSIPYGLICACQKDCSPAAAHCPFVPPLSGTLWPSWLPATKQWMLGGAINSSPQLGHSNSGCKYESVFKLDMNLQMFSCPTGPHLIYVLIAC